MRHHAMGAPASAQGAGHCQPCVILRSHFSVTHGRYCRPFQSGKILLTLIVAMATLRRGIITIVARNSTAVSTAQAMPR